MNSTDNKTKNEILLKKGEISVGLTIRPITTCLLQEYASTIKDLANKTSPEGKRNILTNMIINDNEWIKKLLKFIKNCKKNEKIKTIFQVTGQCFGFKDNIKYIMDQLYYTSQMCKYYRTPAFNIKETVSIINHSSHRELKKSWYNELQLLQSYKFAPRNIQYEFTLKYFYNESLNASFNFDKIQEDCKSTLHISEQLFMFNMSNSKPNKGIKVDFKKNMWHVSFRDIVLFQFIPYITAPIQSQDKVDVVMQEGKENTESNSKEKESKMSYFCKSLIFCKNYPPFTNNENKTRILNQQWRNQLNNWITNSILISIPPTTTTNEVHTTNHTINLMLDNWVDFLKEFVYEYINPFIFAFYSTKMVKFKRKYQFPIEINKISKTQIQWKYWPDPRIIPMSISSPFTLDITLKSEDSLILIKSSHTLLPIDPFIYIENNENVFSIRTFQYENIISCQIRDFDHILINEIWEALTLVPSMYVRHVFLWNFPQKKIDFKMGENNILFSVIINSLGTIDWIDFEFVFTKEDCIFIIGLLLDFIKGDYTRVKDFNTFVFKSYMEKYFTTSSLKIVVDYIGEERVWDGVVLSNDEDVNWTCKSNEDELRWTYFIPKYVSNKLNVKLMMHIKCHFSNEVRPGNPNKENLLKINSARFCFYNKVQQKSSLDNSINFLSLLNLKETSFEISPQTFTYLNTCVCTALAENDEFISNAWELMGLTNKEYSEKIYRLPKNPKSNEHIIITLEKEYLDVFKDILQKDSLYELFRKLIYKVEIWNYNLCYKFYFHKEILSQLIPLKTESYSWMDTEIIIGFNSESYCLSFYVLSKLKSPDRSFLNKIWHTLLIKVLKFLSWIRDILSLDFNSTIVSNPYVFSWLLFGFTIHSLGGKRWIWVQLNGEYKSERFWKIFLPVKCFFEFESDHILVINESKENLLDNCRFYLLVLDIFEFLSKYFVNYIMFSNRVNIKADVTENSIFVLIKDNNSFELTRKNDFSIILEVHGVDSIRIYSNFSTNPEKSEALLCLIHDWNRASQNNCGNNALGNWATFSTITTMTRMKYITICEKNMLRWAERMTELCKWILSFR